MICLEHVLNTAGLLSGIRGIGCAIRGHVLNTSLNTEFLQHCISSDCIGQRARMSKAGEMQKNRTSIEYSQHLCGFLLVAEEGFEPTTRGL